MTRNPLRTHLITHSGTFHADDVLAYTVLKDLFPEAKLVRTRDEKVLQAGKDSNTVGNKNCIIFDVGGEHNIHRDLFDHHQANAPMRQDGTPFSSFGMIWNRYGSEWVHKKLNTDLAHNRKIVQNLNAGFVANIDRQDSGHGAPTLPTDLSAMIARFNLPAIDKNGNPIKHEDKDIDQAFVRASTWAKPILMQAAVEAQQEAVVETLLENTIQSRKNPKDPILILDQNLPWERSIFNVQGHEHIAFVLTPSREGDWGVQSIAESKGSFIPKHPFPKTWAGLRNEDLEKVSGMKGAVFCHKGLYFAVHNTQEGAKNMAKTALGKGTKTRDTGFER